MLKGKTKSGFAYEISDEDLNNYELFEVISQVDENPLKLPKMIQMLLGEDQKQKLIEHLRNEKGVVTIDSIRDEIMEILQGNKKTKNS